MKRRNIVILIMVALVIGLMGSCDALFENQFKLAGLGQITAEDLVDSDANTLLEDSGVETGTISQAFIDAAIADPDTQQAVLEELQGAVDTSTDPVVVQGASVLILEIEMQAAGADQMVDNLIDVIGVATAEGFDPGTNPEDMTAVIDALIPADVQDDPVALAAMLDALADLADNMDALAANLDTNGGEYATDGVDAGSVAQTAIMVAVLDALDPVGDQTIGEALAEALSDPNPANFSLYVSMPEGALEGLTTDATLLTLFGAAGIDFSAFLPSGEV